MGVLRTRIWRVPVHVDRSWLAVLGMIAGGYGLFAYASIPDTQPLTAASSGILVGLALSASLLLHELAHARSALAAGIEVDHVRIHAGGGSCQRRQEIEHAHHQFRIAAAGPLSSLAIGTATVLALLALAPADMAGSLTMAAWLVAFTNTVIAVSTLLPVFPFDGGTLLHAVYWRRSGDRRVASALLRRTGRSFARVVLGLGVLLVAGSEVLLGGLVAGLGLYLLAMPSPT